MYKAPIELISSPPKFDIDGEIYKAIVKCGVSVDKDELIKALQYDRDQYDKGYADAKAEVAREIFAEIDKRFEALLKFYPFGGEVTDAKKFVNVHWKHIRHSIMCDYDAELEKKYTEGET